MTPTSARFGLGEIVRHRDSAFRGVVLDVDPVFLGRVEETGKVSPDQPFYQVLALGEQGGFVAYAAEEALEPDPDLKSLSALDRHRFFNIDDHGRHWPKALAIH